MGVLAPVVPNKALPIVNCVAFIVTVTINALASTGVIGTPVGEVSDGYRTMITPNSSAFSIWGLIYFCLAVFVIWQLIPSVRNDEIVFENIGYWFLLSCIFNSLWIVLFTQFELWAVWVSSVLLFLIVGSLTVILVRVNVFQRAFTPGRKANGRNCGLGFLEYLCVDFAFSVYGGWTTAAAILNVALSLTASGFYGGDKQEWWAIAILIIASIIYIANVLTRSNWAFGFVCTWAFLMISNNDKNCMVVQYTNSTNKSQREACDQVQETAKILGLIVAGISAIMLIVWSVRLAKRPSNDGAQVKNKSNENNTSSQGITYA